MRFKIVSLGLWSIKHYLKYCKGMSNSSLDILIICWIKVSIYHFYVFVSIDYSVSPKDWRYQRWIFVINGKRISTFLPVRVGWLFEWRSGFIGLTKIWILAFLTASIDQRSNIQAGASIQSQVQWSHQMENQHLLKEAIHHHLGHVSSNWVSLKSSTVGLEGSN